MPLAKQGVIVPSKLHYYGYNLHAEYTVKEVFQSLDVSPVSAHDLNYLKDTKSQLQNCIFLGDKGYL